MNMMHDFYVERVQVFMDVVVPVTTEPAVHKAMKEVCYQRLFNSEFLRHISLHTEKQ